MNPAAQRYHDLLATLDAWTATAHSRHPGIIPCRRGCTACCHGPFDISAADVLLLRETVAALPEAEQALIRSRARAASARQLELAPAWPAPYDVRTLGEGPFDDLCEALAAEPCPCLVEERCAVYEGRPAVCRIMGLGLKTLEGHTLANDCPIQDQFPRYAALPAQAFDLATFEETEKACLEEAGLLLFDSREAAGFETTIALALGGPAPDA